MNSNLTIGVVFTPQEWAKFAIEEFSIFDKWINGATIFDPTMGSGDLLLALVHYGIQKEIPIEDLPLDKIFGNELNKENYLSTLQRFQDDFNIDLSSNFTNCDLLKLKPRQFDIILGNPPWANFNDLPTEYKEEIKEHFHAYDLITSSQNLLLGGSRIDIAALIIQCSILNFLSMEGEAYFFMPLSLLLNDGAHATFRHYSIGDTSYALKSVYDFGEEKIFKNVATRYGLVHFKRDEITNYPIEYKRIEAHKWIDYQARPLINRSDPLSVYPLTASAPLANFELISLPKTSAPRQGINTCGANAIFFFDSYELVNEQTCLVNGEDKLPIEFVHPLLTAQNFREHDLSPNKWVLLPYSSNGKPLSSELINRIPLLKSYLEKHKEKLQSRKGVMIGASLKRGVWWAMLGVGNYNFSPYKIVWEAYGKTTFRPKLIHSEWQVNQALQCYIPMQKKNDAKKLLAKLKDPKIEEYLLSMKMEGTMNWAQPGKIKKLIQFTD